MQGTIPQKVGRVVANLCTHPQYVTRCLVHNVIGRKMPVDLELPWFSYEAIDFLEKFLEPDMSVCEYGSGGSTLFFSKRVRRVYSIESDPQWHALLQERIAEKGITNVTMKLSPFDFKKADDFENSAYLHSLPHERFDVIVVDGMEEWTRVRPICFQKAEKHVKEGGIIVVDDSWRYPEIRQGNNAKRFQIFQSVGPSRPGVTSTDVYFY